MRGDIKAILSDTIINGVLHYVERCISMLCAQDIISDNIIPQIQIVQSKYRISTT